MGYLFEYRGGGAHFLFGLLGLLLRLNLRCHRSRLGLGLLLGLQVALQILQVRFLRSPKQNT